MKIKINNTFLELVQGNITDQTTDAIVNAANSALQMGGGIAGTIRRKEGLEIQQECNRIGGIHGARQQ
jgi:O-acetyl-ADP-ribose deacetylase (regulator of RNase III)